MTVPMTRRSSHGWGKAKNTILMENLWLRCMLIPWTKHIDWKKSIGGLLGDSGYSDCTISCGMKLLQSDTSAIGKCYKCLLGSGNEIGFRSRTVKPVSKLAILQFTGQKSQCLMSVNEYVLYYLRRRKFYEILIRKNKK